MSHRLSLGVSSLTISQISAGPHKFSGPRCQQDCPLFIWNDLFREKQDQTWVGLKRRPVTTVAVIASLLSLSTSKGPPATLTLSGTVRRNRSDAATTTAPGGGAPITECQTGRHKRRVRWEAGRAASSFPFSSGDQRRFFEVRSDAVIIVSVTAARRPLFC